MNNLLLSLRGAGGGLQLGIPDSELSALFAGVRDARTQDSKTADQFYDACEGLVNELRLVTMDNRDAEAFLKPVSRSEVPDYFDVITHPMDLQTVLKKVKSRSYKSKIELSDDLDLIWDNCYRYNSTLDHPLRMCASRLRSKANLLLARITDRMDRMVPKLGQAGLGALPSPPSSNDDLHAKPLVNGKLKLSINGRGIVKPTRLTMRDGKSDRHPLPIKIPPLTARSSTQALSSTPLSSSHASPKPPVAMQQTIPFEDRSAILRTQDDMSLWLKLDAQLEELLTMQPEEHAANTPGSSGNLMTLPLNGPTKPQLNQTLVKKLKAMTDADHERESELASSLNTRSGSLSAGPSHHGINGDITSMKRKRSLSPAMEFAPLQKRPRLSTAPEDCANVSVLHKLLSPSDPLDQALDLWWSASQTNSMLGNAIPGIIQPSPYPVLPPTKPKRRKGDKKGIVNIYPVSIRMDVDEQEAVVRRRSRKKSKKQIDTKATSDGSILNVMSANIMTLRSLRTAHERYSYLTRSQEESKETAADGGEAAAAQQQGAAVMLPENPAVIKERERMLRIPWNVRGPVCEQEAEECFGWMCGRVIEHNTFQGTSTRALEQLTDLAIEYISNVGRTMRLLLDKCDKKMSPEEIILHTLFENGIPSVSDLEYYITDDIVRHGTRLQEVEKKVNAALQEIVNADVMDDDAVFGDGADEDNFSSGLFGEILGEDYLGLEASGIMGEIGISGLSIPKRLWKGKKTAEDSETPGQQKGEPPVPFPLPPPFIPIRSDKVDNQIGLIQSYYRDRFTALTTPTDANSAQPPQIPGAATIPTIAVQPPTTPTLFSTPMVAAPSAPSMLAPPTSYLPSSSAPAEPLVLQDDPPDPLRTKIGSLGQIVTTNPAASAHKKKPKPPAEKPPKAPPAAASGGGAAAKKGPAPGPKPSPLSQVITASTVSTPSPKKKKPPANSGGANVNGTPSGGKKGAGSKGGKGGSASPSKGPSSNGPTLIPPV